LCLVALKTGMRQGELFALRWGDVDLEQAVVRVRRSYTRGVVSTPKNRERRDVDLISDVVELLRGWRQTRSMSLEDSLVFPGADGRAFLTPTVLLRRHLYPAMTRAGISRVGPTQEKRTFHSFRPHVCETRARDRGANHLAVTPSRALVAQSDNRHLRTLGACGAETPGGQDGRCLLGVMGTWSPMQRSSETRLSELIPHFQVVPHGPGRSRTCDLGIKSPLLYQLSYRPVRASVDRRTTSARLFLPPPSTSGPGRHRFKE
jgi:hypothetical protein